MADLDPPRNGRDLARRYYTAVVAPLLAARWPGLPHAAGRLGQGSDVLGLDDEMSRDHDWGLRLTLVVDADAREDVAGLLDSQLPPTFAGHPTRFPLSHRPEGGSAVDVTTASGFARAHLGLDPREGLSARDWLALTGQAVLEVVAGPVFHDSAGEISEIRRRLAWYPEDVWRHVLAADWARLGEELPLMSRAGERGDDLGSRVIAARLVDVTMHLGFLLSRRWPPYPKWRGTEFARLPGLRPVARALAACLAAGDWRTRQSALGTALEELLRLQGAQGLPARPVATVPFHDRPYLHPDPGIVDDLLAGVADASVRELPRGRGSVEQQTDNVALLLDPRARRALVEPP